MAKCDLKIDWCSYEAAKYACEHWHYSKCMPVGKLVKIGVWEDGKFVGVVIFSRGANKNMLKPFGLSVDEGCELTRIGLTEHKTEVSKIVRIAVLFLKKICPSLRLVVSYADSEQGHHGGVYQAGNWIYDMCSKLDQVIVNGKQIHKKSLYSKYGHSSISRLKNMGLQCVKKTEGGGKHRYLMPLDNETRQKILPLSKPYPKRVKQAITGDQSDSGGVAPTYTLQQKAGEK